MSNDYNGTVDLISGIRPKNNGTFPLVNAQDVLMPNGSRLSEVTIGGGGGNSNTELDTSLTEPDKAAEAKATGDKIDSVAREFDTQIQGLNTEISSLANKPTGTIVKLITWEEGE